jgi:hypothetical protein
LANGEVIETVGFCVSLKLAVTLASELTVQVPVELVQDPLQPENVEPDEGLAVKVTVSPLLAELGQALPPQVTLPWPVPAVEIDIL